MAKHFDIISDFNSKYNELLIKNLKESDYLDVLKMIMKCADIGHGAKQTELHTKWSFLIIDEFNSQVEKEKLNDLPPSMPVSSNSNELSKSQNGFLKSIVLPLFKSLNDVLQSKKIEKKCVD